MNYLNAKDIVLAWIFKLYNFAYCIETSSDCISTVLQNRSVELS